MKQKVTKWLDVFSRENIIDKKEIVDDVCYSDCRQSGV